MKQGILLVCIQIVLLLQVDCHYSKIEAWPNGLIEYTYIGNFNSREKYLILQAIKEWESVCNIDFIYINYSKDYIYKIIKDRSLNNTSASTVGYCREAHLVINQCTYSILLHELGHCLGLQHEHQRPDRNKYIEVSWDNVKFDALENFFVKFESDYLVEYNKYQYDYNSIMHYSNKSFSKNKEKVMVCKKNKNCNLGSDSISQIDVWKVQYIYGKKKQRL